MGMSDWEKSLKRRTDNIGFLSKLGAFRDPTPAEIARALMIETESWQASKGKKTYTTTEEYSIAKYNYEVEYKHTESPHRKEAIKAYIQTPIDIGKETWLVMDWWTAIKHWFKNNKIKTEEIK